MTDLKTRIARGEYEIDSRDVAEAILAKLNTVRRVRAHLAGPPTTTARFEPADWRADRRGVTL